MAEVPMTGALPLDSMTASGANHLAKAGPPPWTVSLENLESSL